MSKILYNMEKLYLMEHLDLELSIMVELFMLNIQLCHFMVTPHSLTTLEVVVMVLVVEEVRNTKIVISANIIVVKFSFQLFLKIQISL